MERRDTTADHLEAIGLDELDAEASLQTRVDRKYVVDRTALDALLAHLGTQARVLDVDGRRQFGYWSTYFDTPERSSYLDAARKRPRRWKVRTRTYLDNDLHYVEVKTRNGRGRTVKARQSALAGDHDRLGAGSADFVGATLGGALGLTPEAAGQIVVALQPSLTTEYHRTTLFLAADCSRATIDTGLAVCSPGTSPRRFNDQVIIETKTSGRPSLVDRALWERGVRPVSISKFGAGLAVLQPSLPASKWNRVLRSHFAWVPDHAA